MIFDRKKLFEEHHVFKHSFLKEAKIVAAFPEISVEQINSQMREFLNFAYKIDPATVNESVDEGVEIRTKGNGLSFQFERTLAKASISGKDYHSFKNSLLKFSRPLPEYAKMVAGIEALTSVSVTKVNSWRLRTENPSKFIQEGLEFIFRKERMAEMPKIEFPSKEDGAKRVSIVSNPTIPGVDHKLNLVLDVSRSEDNFIGYSLTTTASSDGEVDIKDFPRTALNLNKFLYWVFLDMVSDNVLELMDKEEQDDDAL